MVNSDVRTYGYRMNDPLQDLPGYLLRRASAASLADLNLRLEPTGLRHTDAALLVLIDANPGITQSLLGKALDIQRANMAPMIARLDTKGFVSREPVDGRSEGLYLTWDGQATLAKARAAMDAHEASLLKGIAPEMRPLIGPLLKSLWSRQH